MRAPHRNVALMVFAALVAASPATGQEPDDWTPVQHQVWDAVQARFDAWADDDLDAFMTATHDDWRRWSMGSGRLMDKRGYAGFWEDLKKKEEVLRMELRPVAIEIYGDDDVAVAHFISEETFRLKGESSETEEVRQSNDELTVVFRWSEFLVKEEDRWLTVGGHRDRLCLLGDDLTDDSDRICKE